MVSVAARADTPNATKTAAASRPAQSVFIRHLLPKTAAYTPRFNGVSTSASHLPRWWQEPSIDLERGAETHQDNLAVVCGERAAAVSGPTACPAIRERKVVV